MQSDITVNRAVCTDAAVAADTAQAMAALASRTGPKWHEVGAQRYRALHEDGRAALPKPVYLPGARDESIPSREAGRTIPVRVYAPDGGGGGASCGGVFMHVHGGGYVLFSQRHCDATLRRIANNCRLAVVSVGYRLAPEHPYPAPLNDIVDGACYLADHPERFGGLLRFIGGESAGAHGTLTACFALMRERPAVKLAGLVLTCGLFDMSASLPAAVAARDTVVIDKTDLAKFSEALLPGRDRAALQDGAVSPLFVDLKRLAAASPHQSLPPAIFCCGTADALVDDTLLMGVKWQMAGAEAVVRLFPGAPHAFTALPMLAESRKAVECIDEFINMQLRKVM